MHEILWVLTFTVHSLCAIGAQQSRDGGVLQALGAAQARAKLAWRLLGRLIVHLSQGVAANRTSIVLVTSRPADLARMCDCTPSLLLSQHAITQL